MKLFRLFVIGLALTQAACDKPEADLPIERGQFHVRSIWLDQCAVYPIRAGSRMTASTHSVISLQKEDGSLLSLYTLTLEPRMWQGMHAEVSYRKSRRYCDLHPEIQIYEISDVKEIK